ncbi:MAG TPA: sulfotransferase [Caulobacteraceae bacterium]|nr:sulfotransferase [Caulobacteraceae bacterium]
MNDAAPASPARRPPTAELGFQRAQALHRQGRLAEAEGLYRAVLDIQPDHAGALHYLGLAQSQQGRARETVVSIRKSIAIRPTAAAHNDLGLVLAALGDADGAQAEYRRALALDPDCLEAHNNLGNLLRAAGRAGEALAHFEAALRLAGEVPELHANLGHLLAELGREDEARQAFRRALDLRPQFVDALRGLAQVQIRAGERGEAAALLRRALEAAEDDAPTHHSLGTLLSAEGDIEGAIVHLQRAVALKPDFAEAQNNLGNALGAAERRTEALAAFDGALALRPDFLEALCGRGHTLNMLNRADEALVPLQAALALAPDLAEAHSALGGALQTLGRLDASREAFERAVALEPGRPAYLRGLSEAKRFTPGDPHLALLEAAAERADAFEDAERLQLWYALGKAYDDLGRPEDSLRCLLAGSALKRAGIEYREDVTLAMFRRVEEVFTPDLLQRLGGQGDPSAAPVFIVGMPRSGTTLVEQILASHPEVFGAGERPELQMTARGMQWVSGVPSFPDVVPGLPASRLKTLGAEIDASLRALAPWAARITDKMPHNFLYVGLIRLVLPNARIIALERDPVDTCLSCFSKLFASGQSHTYDLAELGRYHVAFQRLMRHWRSAIPAEALLTVRYEDVVEDLEGQARRLVDHIGLQWSDRCLEFHRTERPVRTASATQVRQPIYHSSVGRSRKYGRLLAPLLDALGTTAD